MEMIDITTIGGSLRVGDVITFEGIPYRPWYKRMWLCLRYMRHNNPMYKPPELRQFVVSWSKSNEAQAEIAP